MARLRNGGFENPALPAGPGVQTFLAGEKIAGWKVKSGNVDLVPTERVTAAEGQQFLDLNGTTAGTIMAKLATVAGQTYTISFLYAGNPENPGITQHMLTAKAGGESLVVVADSSGATNLDPGWEAASFSFTATGTRTKLSFSGDPTNGFNGPLLDGITVEEAASTLSSADWLL